MDDIDDDTTNIDSHTSHDHAGGDVEAGNNGVALAFGGTTSPSIPDETTELTPNSNVSRNSNQNNSNQSSNLQPGDARYQNHQNERTAAAASSSPSSSASRQQTLEEQTHTIQSSTQQSSSSQSNVVVSEDEPEITQPDAETLQSRLETQLHYLTDQSEMYKHSTQTWTVIVSLLLMRIWLEAIISGDIGLMSISLVCTSYFLRWKRYRAMQVQRFDERIEYLTQLSNNDGHSGDDERDMNDDENDDEEVGLSESNVGAGGSGSGSMRSRRWRRQNRNRLRMEFDRDDHVDFEMLSFQAQLALALMESQQMMQNGVNNENNRQNEQSRGVSDETKEKWNSFEFSNEKDFHALVEKNLKWNDYDSAKGDKEGEVEAPSCCICLCEYEEGEKMIQLPCGHVFHGDCIDSWTQNHSTCPLCNAELEDSNSNVNAEDDSTSNVTSIRVYV